MGNQLLLNGMLPPSEKYAQNLKANEKLTDTEKQLLYQIVDDCQKQESAFNVDAALDTIASSFSSCFGNGKEAPFLIKQVIFCITVNCLKCNKKSQKDILDYLSSKGVSITHNFFTRLDRTPSMYCSRSIPEHFINYMGQKHDELGVAIRNLVWQAGNYDVFYDLFGGSGSAVLAVDKLPQKYYMYNELNKSVHNLIYVVKDDKLYGYLISGLRVLRGYLLNGGQQYGSMNLQAELLNAGTYAKTPDTQKKDQGIIAQGLVKSRQARAYAYFSYFMGLLEHPETIPLNRVDHAMAEIFRQFFKIRTTDSSSVLSCLRTRQNRIDSFADTDMLEKMKGIHQELSGIGTENEAFDIFLKKEYLPENVLFYADPPYLGTTDYKDENNGVDEFTKEDMKQLIEGLVDSGKQFILSCRAVKSREVYIEEGSAADRNIKKLNLNLIKNFYNVFKDYISDGKVNTFYVLAVEDVSDRLPGYYIDFYPGTLPYMIFESFPIELFITNFKVESFLDLGCSDYKFTAYDFTELLKFLEDYMYI